MHLLPRYALGGLALIAISETCMLLQIEPFWSWHTPIAWSGYILLVDGIVSRRRGSSWLTSARREFAFLALASIPLWLIFEFYNLFIQNWAYINLPEQPFWRGLGYAWSFATIWPAIFESGDLMASFRRPSSHASREPAGPPGASGVTGQAERPRRPGLRLTSVMAGAAMLVWPLVWPSPYLAAAVWLGFIFLLDPINARLGGEALVTDLARGRWARAINLAWAGLLCGVLWEFWNYRARTKWLYTVPILENVKLFEMPLPGYLGFPAFALECFTMYVTARLLLWRRASRPIAL